MGTFDTCKKRLIEIGKTKFEAENEMEVKHGIKLCNTLIKEIRTIKGDLNLEIKNIRNSYSQETGRIASKNYTIASLIFGRSTPGKLRAANKRQLSLDLQNAISPCENLKLTADDLINQIVNIRNKYEHLKGSFPMENSDQVDKKVTSGEVFDQIEKLGDLMKKGLLSNEEFESKKRELLDKL